MSSQIERIGNTLYPETGARVSNVKFYLGHTRAVTAEQLADQIDRASAQVRQGAATRVGSIDGWQPC
ncbi:MAG TPA: hypothetical protein DCF67_04430 [Brevundimonas sp.]|nr:hypothetical protein [Brevundimonas sp.]